MLLSATLLVLAAITLCAFAIRKTLAVLGLGAMQTLLWLGIAEVPAPPVSRRRRIT